jgi:hypothetical protein
MLEAVKWNNGDPITLDPLCLSFTIDARCRDVGWWGHHCPLFRCDTCVAWHAFLCTWKLYDVWCVLLQATCSVSYIPPYSLLHWLYIFSSSNCNKCKFILRFYVHIKTQISRNWNFAVFEPKWEQGTGELRHPNEECRNLYSLRVLLRRESRRWV